MPADNNILLIPWNEHFMSGLLEIVQERTAGQWSRAIIVFPHIRPRRAFLDLMARDERVPKPFMAPGIFSIREFISTIKFNLDPQVASSEAGYLDQIGLLSECLKELGLLDSGAMSALTRMREDVFFPWGLRLAGLIEAMLEHGLRPEDMRLYGDEALQPFASAVLRQLGGIFELYVRKLSDRGLSTPGLEAFTVAAHADRLEELFAGKQIFLAGFHAPAGAVEKLFRRLWSQGLATVILNGDPKLAERDGKIHWSCAAHAAMLKKWGAKVDLFSREDKTVGPKLTFYEAFDLHSQLKALARTMKDRSPSCDSDAMSGVGVILPDTAMLMPTLHHLPVKEVNISMGYPFGVTPLAQLLDLVLRLQEGAAGPDGYYWRDLIALLRHPYLAMLERGGQRPLRDIFHLFEESIRRQGKFVDPVRWASDPDLALAFERGLARLDSLRPEGGAPLDRQDLADLVDLVFRLTLTAFQDLSTLNELCQAVNDLAACLVEQGGQVWERFPMDAEFLYRLINNILPSLSGSALSDLSYARPTLFEIFRQSLKAERVPFEAYPLTGLQILGFLESRLFNFDTLYLLGANDDLLPGHNQPDPLLPDSLRHTLGLPDSRAGELVSAFNFFSLIQASGEAIIFYENSVESSDALERPSGRSRFVEELIWEEERRCGHLIKAGQPPVHRVEYHVEAPAGLARAVPGTPAALERLQAVLNSAPLSLSALDRFLRCPASFFYQRVAGLKPVREVSEEGQASDIGQAGHLALYEYLKDRLNRPLGQADHDPAQIGELYKKHLRSFANWEHLPYASKLLMEESGLARLEAYLAVMPQTSVLALEKDYVGSLRTAGQTVRLGGRIDRVDLRAEGLLILDYKTGALPSGRKSFWTEEDIWSELSGLRDDDLADPDLMARLAAGLGSIQLPGYMWLYEQSQGRAAHDAAWVDLRQDGREKSFLGARLKKDIREKIVQERIPRLMQTVVAQIVLGREFTARPGEYCRYCPYLSICVG